jgi:hypothetical protein
MRQLFIDSRDRVTGSTTDFTIQLRETLSTTGGVNFFRIDELRVPLVIPLIRAGVNDTFWYSLGGITKSVTLAAGNYSGTDLAALIKAELDDHSPEDTWTVTYNNHLASLSIFCTDQTFLALTDTAVTAAGHALPTFASAMFQNAYSYITGGGRGITWSYCSMVAVDMMYLSSNKLASQDTFGPNGATDTIMASVTQGDFASVLNASMSTGIWLSMPTLTTSTLDFQLRDRGYNVLQNLPNISFVMTIR